MYQKRFVYLSTIVLLNRDARLITTIKQRQTLNQIIDSVSSRFHISELGYRGLFVDINITVIHNLQQDIQIFFFLIKKEFRPLTDTSFLIYRNLHSILLIAFIKEQNIQ